MSYSHTSLRTLAWTALLPLLTTAAALGWARSYQTEVVGNHIARCSTVNTATLPEASLQQYRLAADPSRGLLNCMVQLDKQEFEPENVRAEVRARYRPVGRVWQEFEMREIRMNDMVSYLGTYSTRGEEALQFDVMVDAPGAGRIRLQFDDLDPRL
jgi:hypothetical protein